MDIRLIAFDLDGTLLRSDKSISPRTMQALLAARERGVLLVPSTGRLLRSLPEPLLDKNLTRYHILVNGAQVYDSFEDKTLLREELTPQQAMCMLHFLKAHNVLRGFKSIKQRHVAIDLVLALHTHGDRRYAGQAERVGYRFFAAAEQIASA